MLFFKIVHYSIDPAETFVTISGCIFETLLFQLEMSRYVIFDMKVVSLCLYPAMNYFLTRWKNILSMIMSTNNITLVTLFSLPEQSFSNHWCIWALLTLYFLCRNQRLHSTYFICFSQQVTQRAKSYKVNERISYLFYFLQGAQT